MKTSLLFGFTLLYALSVTVDAAKGGLSKEEQMKLLREINKDRRAVANKYPLVLMDLTYDTNLEKKAAEQPDCYRTPMIWLQWNSVAEDFYTSGIPNESPYVQFFASNQTTIGCSKEVRCSVILEGDPGTRKRFKGKELVTLGGCLLGPNVYVSGPTQLHKSLIPKGAKYGDLLGIKISSGEDVKTGTLTSSGNTFGIVVFLAIMVFYF